MKINSNIQAMRTGNLLKNNEAKFTVSSEKMSSGYKINSAKDNPSGMAISNKMRAQLRSLNKANQNASNAVNVIETADSALAEIEDMIHRLNELSVKSANGTNTTEDREAIQSEVSQLLDEIETIAKDTEYNTQSLLGGEQRLKGYASMVEVEVEDYDPGFPYRDDYSVTFNSDGDGNVSVESSEGFENTAKITTEGDRITVTNHDGSKLVLSVDTQTLGAGSFTTTLDINGVGGMKIQTGALEGQEIQIVIPRISLENLHFDNMDVRTDTGAREAIDNCAKALSYVSSIRSRLGAYQNRFESTITNLDSTTENLTKSYSTIKDVDMADEMVEYTTLQVLVQAGTSMLSQANEQPQQALQLLQ